MDGVIDKPSITSIMRQKRISSRLGNQQNLLGFKNCHTVAGADRDATGKKDDEIGDGGASEVQTVVAAPGGKK